MKLDVVNWCNRCKLWRCEKRMNSAIYSLQSVQRMDAKTPKAPTPHFSQAFLKRVPLLVSVPWEARLQRIWVCLQICWFLASQLTRSETPQAASHSPRYNEHHMLWCVPAAQGGHGCQTLFEATSIGDLSQQTPLAPKNPTRFWTTQGSNGFTSKASHWSQKTRHLKDSFDESECVFLFLLVGFWGEKS